MADLLRRNRFKRWRTLRQFDPRIPELGTPRDLQSLRSVAGLLVLIGALIVGMALGATSTSLGIVAALGTLLVGGAAFNGLYPVTEPLERVIPTEAATIRDLVRMCAPVCKPSVDTPSTRPTDDYLMLEVRRIIADVTSLPLEEVKPESDLFKDLGMG